jgi:peptidoglycan lytic transglycosylase
MRRGSTTSRTITAARAGAAALALLTAATSVVYAGQRRRHSAPSRHSFSFHRSAGSLPPGGVQEGIATWYGPGFYGRRTASGERFDRNAMTLAHRHMPFGTRVRVTNLKNGKSVVGRVNDRGPFVRGRSFDLSQGMARRLGISGAGKVRVEVIRPDTASAGSDR